MNTSRRLAIRGLAGEIHTLRAEVACLRSELDEARAEVLAWRGRGGGLPGWKFVGLANGIPIWDRRIGGAGVLSVRGVDWWALGCRFGTADTVRGAMRAAEEAAEAEGVDLG